MNRQDGLRRIVSGSPQGCRHSPCHPSCPVFRYRVNNDAHFPHGELSLSLGKACFPYPQNVQTGSEDVMFLARNAFGVFDGVAGRTKEGVISKIYARELCRLTAEYVAGAGQRYIVDALNNAVMNNREPGTSTACVASLSQGHLRGVNVGDSGLIVFRDGRNIFKTERQQHSFKIPFRLGFSSNDKVEDGEHFDFPTRVGDLIVMGSDGLWDNMELDEIAECLFYSLHLSPRRKLQKPLVQNAEGISLQAYCRSKRKSGMSPFVRDALKSDIVKEGGRMDHITVIVAEVVER